MPRPLLTPRRRLRLESLEDRSMLSAAASAIPAAHAETSPVSTAPAANAVAPLQTVSPQVTDSATAEITYAQVSAGVNQYTVFLQNTGTALIGTLWYGWVPGEDFIPVS